MKRMLTLLAVTACLAALTACNGAAKEEKIQCIKCGEDILAGNSFCGSCGASVENQKTQPVTDTLPVREEVEQTDPPQTDHAHSYAKSVVAATCTKAGYDIYVCSCGDSYKMNQTPAKGHSYAKNTTPATCTQQGYTTYTCTCGDTYRGDFVQPSHRYVNYICTACGAREVNYSGFQAEYAQLTAQYDAEIAELRSKIAECESNIDNYEQENRRAQLDIQTISTTCPQWFRQQYIDNYKLFGDTYTASQAAQAAWEQQCYAERAELERIISVNQSKIQTEQSKISTYNSMISSCTDQYNGNVDILERKYGLG